MPNYKLMYLDVPGDAELSRYLFALAGKENEDQCLNKDTWPAIKPQTVTGQLPALSVDGRIYSQSIPIAMYLSKEFCYYGNNPLENLAILEVVSIVRDLREAMGKAYLEIDNAELMKKLKEEDIPNFLKIFEKLLAKSSSEYFSANKLTLAELVVMDALVTPVKDNPKLLDGTPKLKANFQIVRNNPKIKALIEGR